MERANNQPVIVPAGPEHLPEIAALAGIVWRAHYPGIISHDQIQYMLAHMYDLDVMRQELAQGTSYDRLLVGSDLRGFASYGPVESKAEMKLHKLYLHPEWQRRGLGGLLLKHVEEATRKRSFRRLILTVNKSNHQAIGAYHKNGFAIRESVCVEIGGGFVMDDYLMEKYL